MIEELEQLAANDCSAWFELSYEEQEAFTKKYAAYVDTNPSETQAYLQEQEVTFAGVLSIAFEAISCFSNHPAVLLPTVKKIVDRSYNQEEFELWNLEVIENIDTIELFERDKTVYMQYMDLLVSHLQPEKDPEYLIKLLDIFDLAFMPPENASENQYVRKKWFDTITVLANYNLLKVKIAARKVITNSEQDCELIPLTWMEKIKKLF
jgi:hypothetical protein